MATPLPGGEKHLRETGSCPKIRNLLGVDLGPESNFLLLIQFAFHYFSLKPLPRVELEVGPGGPATSTRYESSTGSAVRGERMEFSRTSLRGSIAWA